MFEQNVYTVFKYSNPPQGQSVDQAIFRPYRPSLTSEIFPVGFPYKNNSQVLSSRLPLNLLQPSSIQGQTVDILCNSIPSEVS